MQKKANAAEQKLQAQHSRKPNVEEIAAEMEIAPEALMEWQQAFQANVHQSLDSVYDEFSIWFESPENTPEDNLNDEELRGMLKDALRTLSEREGLVIQLYYVEELNVYEIAEILEVTTGRVSQIKSAAVARLRQYLRDQDKMLVAE